MEKVSGYKFVRMPKEAFDMFFAKKIKMEKDIVEMTGKPIKISMPKVFGLVAKHPVEIDKDLLIKTAKKRRFVY